MLIPTVWNSRSPVTELSFAFPFQEAASWHSVHESCPGPSPECRKAMCSTRAKFVVAKTIKESGKFAASSLAHPGGLESQQPSGRWQQALGGEHLHDLTKRQEVKQMPVGEEREASLQGMQWPHIIFPHVFKPHRKGRWKLWIKIKKKKKMDWKRLGKEFKC